MIGKSDHNLLKIAQDMHIDASTLEQMNETLENMNNENNKNNKNNNNHNNNNHNNNNHNNDNNNNGNAKTNLQNLPQVTIMNDDNDNSSYHVSSDSLMGPQYFAKSVYPEVADVLKAEPKGVIRSHFEKSRFGMPTKKRNMEKKLKQKQEKKIERK